VRGVAPAARTGKKEMNWLEVEYLGNSLRLWMVSAAIVGAAWFGLTLARALLVRRLSKIAARSEGTLDDIVVALIRAVRSVSIAAIAIYLGSRVIVLPAQAGDLIRIALTLALAYQAVCWGSVLIDTWLERNLAPAPPAGLAARGAKLAFGYGAVKFVARVLLWGLVALVALDNLGIQVTTLVAGLGVGGIAVALAVQNILGDVFNSLSIVLDKPFEVGDFIIVGDLLGTVENIGVKTTRLRSLGGEQLVFSNSDLVSSRVRNYKRMYERRVVFQFGVTYQTPPDLLERIPAMVREIVTSFDDTRFDRAHFASYGDSALTYEVVFYVLSPDYNRYMDRQQAINLEIMRAFAAQGIEFAYPTQTLFVQHAGEERETRNGDRAKSDGGGKGRAATREAGPREEPGSTGRH
jgi:small-conductance mechanosensitive channel